MTEATLKNFKNFTEAGLEGLNAFNEKTGKPTDASSIGIYYVIENSNGSVQLQDIADRTTAASKYVDLAGNSWADDLEIIKGHALQMDKNNNVLLISNTLNSSAITLYEYSRDTASWEPVYSQDNMSLSFTGGVASLKLGGQMVNGERYMVEVDGVQSATVLANK